MHGELGISFPFARAEDVAGLVSVPVRKRVRMVWT
jgi:hypothetical protein